MVMPVSKLEMELTLESPVSFSVLALPNQSSSSNGVQTQAKVMQIAQVSSVTFLLALEVALTLAMKKSQPKR